MAPRAQSRKVKYAQAASAKAQSAMSSMIESIPEQCGSDTDEDRPDYTDEDRPDYMNERVFQRNRLPPRAYFLPDEHLSLNGKWRFHYASSPLEPEPVDNGAWDLIDVPGKPLSRLFMGSFEGQASMQLLLACLGLGVGVMQVDDCCCLQKRHATPK